MTRADEATLNGERVPLAPGDTVAGLLGRLGLPTRGTAVARNGEVVPRSAWSETRVVPGDTLEVLAPAQGG